MSTKLAPMTPIPRPFHSPVEKEWYAVSPSPDSYDNRRVILIGLDLSSRVFLSQFLELLTVDTQQLKGVFG